MIPSHRDTMGADSYAYTSLKYAGVVAEPLGVGLAAAAAGELPGE